ncbi:DUF1800 domain-containing protein [Vibrio nomapromontoriensis]|uniref:DUF1800 domain-containing protein n=1 Tax=Vibrio nomapromontoriensis TaxID=2910246 RepID=UPI003D0DE58A
MDSAQIRAVTAPQRFGLGIRVGDASEPLSLAKQLQVDNDTHELIAELPSTSEMLAHMGELNRRRKEAATPEEKQTFSKTNNAFFQESYRTLVHARNLQSLYSPYGFQERLIQFWSNHFAISADTRRVRPIASGVENDVIRTAWKSDFSSMLIAVCQHPTMLMFLDNHQSIGPNSKAGKKRNKGLNENLAREILELHTLGVSGGYTQTDVIELAQGITGWTVTMGSKEAGYIFRPALHEPGAIQVLNTVYSQEGEAQGIACLADLALRPETAQHVCGKLVQHFYGAGHEELVEALANVWLEKKGQLMPVYEMLMASPLATEPKYLRFRTPQEWYFAVLRSADFEPNQKQMHYMLRQLGQEPFMAGSPAGWSDQDADYNSASGLTQRWQVANQVAQLAVRQVKRNKQRPQDYIDNILQRLYGKNVDEHTLVAIEKAQDAVSKLVVLWMSPQFQYR